MFALVHKSTEMEKVLALNHNQAFLNLCCRQRDSTINTKARGY